MKRVLVIGNGGAGKSHFARQLGKITQLPVIPLDRHYWIGTQEPTRGTWNQTLTKLLQSDSWIMDGNYLNSFPQRALRADTIIFLDYPRWLSFLRAIKRRFRQLLQHPDEKLSGNPEIFTFKFARWILTYPRKKMLQLIHTHKKDATFIHLRSPEEARKFLEAITSNSPSHPMALPLYTGKHEQP